MATYVYAGGDDEDDFGADLFGDEADFGSGDVEDEVSVRRSGARGAIMGPLRTAGCALPVPRRRDESGPELEAKEQLLRGLSFLLRVMRRIDRLTYIRELASAPSHRHF